MSKSAIVSSDPHGSFIKEDGASRVFSARHMMSWLHFPQAPCEKANNFTKYSGENVCVTTTCSSV